MNSFIYCNRQKAQSHEIFRYDMYFLYSSHLQHLLLIFLIVLFASVKKKDKEWGHHDIQNKKSFTIHHSL